MALRGRMTFPKDKPWLGGHGNKVHVDEGSAQWLVREFGIASVIDVGCATGGMREVFARLGVDSWHGVEGDYTLAGSPDVEIHDFTEGPWPGGPRSAHLCWCVEFLEHVDEKFIPNYMETVTRCPWVVATAAPPGHGGHHHVNEREPEYWYGVFAAWGYEFRADLTEMLRSKSTMRKDFIRARGMMFGRRQEAA